MDRVGLGRGQPALGVDLRQLGQFAQGNIDDARARLAQRGQRGLERACDRGLDTLKHEGLRHRHPQSREREGSKVDRGLAGEHRVERDAAFDGCRQRPDGVERGRERKRPRGGNAMRGRLESDDAAQCRRNTA